MSPKEEYEAKLAALREMIEASIAAGGHNSDEDIDAALAEEAEALAKEGY